MKKKILAGVLGAVMALSIPTMVACTNNEQDVPTDGTTVTTPEQEENGLDQLLQNRKDLQEQLNQLDSTISDKYSELATSNEDLLKQIEELKTQLADTTKAKDELDELNKQLNEKIAELEAKISATAKIDELKQTISSLSQTVSYGTFDKDINLVDVFKSIDDSNNTIQETYKSGALTYAEAMELGNKLVGIERELASNYYVYGLTNSFANDVVGEKIVQHKTTGYDLNTYTLTSFDQNKTLTVLSSAAPLSHQTFTSFDGDLYRKCVVGEMYEEAANNTLPSRANMISQCKQTFDNAIKGMTDIDYSPIDGMTCSGTVDNVPTTINYQLNSKGELQSYTTTQDKVADGKVEKVSVSVEYESRDKVYFNEWFAKVQSALDQQKELFAGQEPGNN